MALPAFCGDRRRMLERLAMAGIVPLFMAQRASAQADDEATLERRVKAAFIYNFVPYIGWSPGAFSGPAAPVVLGVLGSEELAMELRAIVANRSVGGRSFQVRTVRENDDLGGVHVVFVSRSAHSRIAALARATGNKPVLIVTESEGAMEQGSVINFVVKEGRVRFDVALDAADRRGIKLSSRLLTVAHSVRTGVEP